MWLTKSGSYKVGKGNKALNNIRILMVLKNFLCLFVCYYIKRIMYNPGMAIYVRSFLNEWSEPASLNKVAISHGTTINIFFFFFSQPPKQTLANSFQVCFPIGSRCPIKYLDCQAHKSCSLSRLRGTQSLLLQIGAFCGVTQTHSAGRRTWREWNAGTDWFTFWQAAARSI